MDENEIKLLVLGKKKRLGTNTKDPYEKSFPKIGGSGYFVLLAEPDDTPEDFEEAKRVAMKYVAEKGTPCYVYRLVGAAEAQKPPVVWTELKS